MQTLEAQSVQPITKQEIALSDRQIGIYPLKTSSSQEKEEIPISNVKHSETKLTIVTGLQDKQHMEQKNSETKLTSTKGNRLPVIFYREKPPSPTVTVASHYLVQRYQDRNAHHQKSRQSRYHHDAVLNAVKNCHHDYFREYLRQTQHPTEHLRS